MTFQEVTSLRNPTSKTFADGLTRQFVGTTATIHYESVIDSGVYDSEIDTTPIRRNDLTFDGWEITQNGFHYRLGQPNGLSDGWVGFGGRQGQNWFNFRLLKVGYLHQPTRNWFDIGGAPNYARANLSNTIKSRIYGPAGQTLNLEGVATWTNLWTTPGGGTAGVRWRVAGDALKEEITVNAAARTWIAANRPPSFFGIPASEAYFGFIFQLDWTDVPKIVLNGIQKQINDDYTDTAPIALRDNLDRLLAFMPIDYAIVYENVDTGRLDSNNQPIFDLIQHRQRLQKRFYFDGTNYFLAMGILATDLAGIPAGDIIFDPTFNGGGGAGTDDAVINDLGYSDTGTTIQWGGVSPTPGANFGEGQRIPNVTIPNGATVSAATIDLVSNGAFTTVKWRLTAIDEDNTATFSSGSPPGSRNITSANISDETVNSNHVAGTRYSFPTTGALQTTLGAACQTVFARAGWSSGNALGIVCNSAKDGSAYQNFSREQMRTYDNAAADAGTVTITYTSSSGIPFFMQTDLLTGQMQELTGNFQ